MNLLTGASACARKAIYELATRGGAEGDDYESRIKDLKNKHPDVDKSLFDVLAHIQDMTSDQVHEQSWPKWDSRHLRLILETLCAVLHEVYVVPEERKERAERVRKLRDEIKAGRVVEPDSSNGTDGEVLDDGTATGLEGAETRGCASPYLSSHLSRDGGVDWTGVETRTLLEKQAGELSGDGVEVRPSY
jgi:hypothetical protein